MKGIVVDRSQAQPLAHPVSLDDRVDTDDLLRAGYELALEGDVIYAKNTKIKWDWMHLKVIQV